MYEDGEFSPDDDVHDDFGFDEESVVCPECHNDDCNLKWYFFDDDADRIVGKLLECESCGTQFNYWYNITF